MSRNKNHPPVANPYDYSPQTAVDPQEQAAAHLEQLRDPAGVVGVASELRNAAYEAGDDTDKIAAFYDPSDPGHRAGAPELILLADTLRNENRFDLTDNEQRFVNHMKIETMHDSYHARVDFDALAADHSDLSDDEAEDAGVRDVISKIQAKLDATTDNDEKATYSGQIRTLNHYLTIAHKVVDYGNTSLENQYMITSQTADTSTGDAKKAAENMLIGQIEKMEERDNDSAYGFQAYDILSEYHPRTPDDPSTLPPDPALEYTPPQPVYKETEATKEIRKAELERRLDQLREEMADSKIRFLSNSKFGKNIVGKLTGNDMEARQAALESEYFKLTSEYGRSQHSNILDDPNIDPQVKIIEATKAVLEEQTRLRAVTNEKLQKTPVAKIARWIGKHKFVTIAGMTILAPVTGGASLAFGLALGGGMVAASKYDQKTRGLRSVDEAVTDDDLNKYHQHLSNGHGYESLQKLAASKYDKDISKERNKRIKAAGILGGTAVGTVLLPSTAGLDSFMNSHSAGILQSVGLGVGGVAILRKPKDKK